MRTWDVINQYPIYSDGVITHTEVTISATAGGYATYSERIVGDWMNKSETEVIDAVREAHFKSEYAERAMAESVQKIDELDHDMQESKKLRAEMQEQLEFAGSKLAEVDEALERNEKQAAELENLIQTVTITLNDLIFGMEETADDETETIE